MSKRFLFILGALLIGVMIFCLNLWVFPSSPYGAYTSRWSPSWGTWAVCVVVWYALCWINSIKEWNRRPVLLFGRYIKTAGPGLVLIEPLLFTVLDDVPVQDVVRNIPAPNVQTKDNVGVGIEAVLTYRIDVDKVKDAVVEVKNIESAISQRALSTINDIGSTTDLDHFLEHRATFGDDVVKKLRERVAKWGVTISAVEIKAFKINDEAVERAIAMKARAEKEAAAELTRANMQKQIAAALNEAAGTYNDQGRWLKGIETLIELCRSANNNTILIPTDIQGAVGHMTKLLAAGTTPSA